MQYTIKMWIFNTKWIQRVSLSLSLLGHLLLLLSFTVAIKFSSPLPFPPKPPGIEINSYVYQPPAQLPTQMQAQENIVEKQKPVAKNGLQKPVPPKKMSTVAHRMNAATRMVNIGPNPEDDPVHMIGDKKVDNKLMKALGKALTKHLVYPKIAADFRIRGIAYIGMTVHPDGSISGVKLLQSSRAAVLDQSALAAAEAAFVPDASVYLHKPKFIVIGIIYR